MPVTMGPSIRGWCWAAAILAGTALAIGCGGGADCSADLVATCPAPPGPLNIELRFLTGTGLQAPTPSQLTAFEHVVARLQKIVTRKLGRSRISTDPGSCGPNSPAIHETVEDLLVLVTLEPIDGRSGAGSGLTVGQGTTCLVRSGSHHPIVSRVTLDRDDLGSLEFTGRLESVILHEMLHALGFGNLWGPNFFNYLVNPSKPGAGGVDTYFSGDSAIVGFDEIGGTGYSGNKVPVENTALLQADSHWRGSVLGGELMQPVLQPGQASKLSLLTLRSLQDLGYSIDLNQADNYTLATAPALGAGVPQTPAVRYDEPVRRAVRIVDRTGRVVRVVQP